MKLSIIIPVFNEENTIIKILKKINYLNINNYQKKKKNNIKIEIIVVNDGSIDKTFNVLKKNATLYTKLLNNKKNYGKGSAVKKGLEYCEGDYVFIQDADEEYDPLDILKFVKCINLFNPDLVIGSRSNYSDYTRSHNFLNKIGNLFITILFNLLYNTTFTDIYSCYICFKKDVFDFKRLKTNGFQQHAEILCNLVNNGSRFYEVPINYNGRTIKEGKKIRYYHILPIIYQIIKSRIVK